MSGTTACGPTGRCNTGRVPQGRYLWDFRQANVTVKGVKMIEWFIEKYMFSELDGLGNPLISGFYIGIIALGQTKNNPNLPLSAQRRRQSAAFDDHDAALKPAAHSSISLHAFLYAGA